MIRLRGDVIDFGRLFILNTYTYIWKILRKGIIDLFRIH